MLDHAGLTVHIVADNQELREFCPPGVSDGNCNVSQTRYVQATIGVGFGIKVDIAKAFDWKDARGLELKISLDGRRVMRLIIDKFSRVHPWSKTWDTILVACPHEKKIIRRAKMIFAAVELGEFATCDYKATPRID